MGGVHPVALPVSAHLGPVPTAVVPAVVPTVLARIAFVPPPPLLSALSSSSSIAPPAVPVPTRTSLPLPLPTATSFTRIPPLPAIIRLAAHLFEGHTVLRERVDDGVLVRLVLVEGRVFAELERVGHPVAELCRRAGLRGWKETRMGGPDRSVSRK